MSAMPADGGTLSAKSTVQSLTKGLRVLEAFTAERSEMSLAEVARAADIDNGTAFRFLNTLVILGYIRKTEAKRFRLTLKCLDLGFRAIGRTELRELARPLLRDLVGPEIEAASVAVLDGAEVVYIERVQAGLARLGIDVRIGSRAPAYSCARDGDPGADRSVEGRSLWRRRADWRGACQHEGRDGRSRHLQKRRHAPADRDAE